MSIARKRAEDARRFPLAYSTLWHRDPKEGRTSQRVAAQVSLQDKLICFVNGGNRAGKTDLGAQWAVAHALGSEDPQVQAWANNNCIDTSRMNKRPGIVWAVSITFSDSRRYIREKLAKYLPAGTKTISWTADGEALAVLPNGGRILCKAWTQGRARFQGDSISAAWVDEEPMDEEAWSELLMRLADKKGRALVTFTPGLMGLTWVYKRYVENVSPLVCSYSIYGTDNPYVPRKALDEILSGYSENERAAREKGEWVSKNGLVYSAWRRQVHVIPPMPIPKEWKRYRGIDFGFADPFACVWLAVDPSDSQIHVYRLLYRPQKTVLENGNTINELSAGETFEATVADSADANSRRILTNDCDIITDKPNKAIEAGIQAVWARLKVGGNGKPGMVVHSCCKELIQEIEGYRWGRDNKPTGLDHSLDALRYIIMYIDRMRDLAGFQCL